MNSSAEKSCLDDPTSFSPRSGHRFIECQFEQGIGATTPRVSEEILQEAEVSSWLHKSPAGNAKNAVSFRLLLCAAREVGQELILPLAARTYEDIAKTWGFPPLVLVSIRQPYSMSAYFRPANQAASSSPSLGLVLRFDSHWECECVVVITTNPHLRQINIMLAGLNTPHIPKFIAALSAASHLLANPLLIPVLIMSELAQNQTDWLALVHPDLEDIQRRLGMANWKYSTDSPFYGPNAAENLLRLDLPGIITMLNRMSDSIRFQDQIALTLIEVMEELEGKLSGDLTMGGDEEGRMQVDDEIGETMTVLLKSLKGCQRRIGYRNGTIHGLIDTVYTLIAQRDNYLSLDVAYHTRRDSTDMRTIAAVTMFFLPGMFTATLFSTSFFDWQADELSGMLSPYHWIYWTTTGVATAFVLIFWFLYANRKKHTDELPDLMGIKQPPNPVPLRSYNTTDVAEDVKRKRRFAGW